jgi:hypothetical protein
LRPYASNQFLLIRWVMTFVNDRLVPIMITLSSCSILTLPYSSTLILETSNPSPLHSCSTSRLPSTAYPPSTRSQLAFDSPECATCHLYLPSTFPAPAPSGDEEDMLGYAIGHRPSESRLGCQIKITAEIRKWAEKRGVIGLPRF